MGFIYKLPSENGLVILVYQPGYGVLSCQHSLQIHPNNVTKLYGSYRWTYIMLNPLYNLWLWIITLFSVRIRVPCYLNMVFVILLNKRVCKEVIVIFDILAAFTCPLDILMFASIILPIIDQAQYKLHSIFSRFWYHKIQSLHTCNSTNKPKYQKYLKWLVK